MRGFSQTLIVLFLFFRGTSAFFAADPSVTPTDSVHELASAQVFAMGGIGIRGLTSKEELAYRAVLRRPDAKITFQEILQTGTPAAQLYALCGLRAVASPDFATAALSLARSELKVTTIKGCIIRSEPLSQVIKRLVDDYPTSKKALASAFLFFAIASTGAQPDFFLTVGLPQGQAATRTAVCPS